MLFKEIAQILNLSERTLRKLIKLSVNAEIKQLAFKRGTGTYFYTGKEVQLIMKNFI
jgi:hypothetical protein